MSTSAVSPFLTQQNLETYFHARHKDLRQLGQALQSGDLASAQQDYVTIKNLGKNGPFLDGNPFLNSNRQQDFESIGSALRSGDLSAARQAFMQLCATFGKSDPQLGGWNDLSQSANISVKA